MASAEKVTGSGGRRVRDTAADIEWLAKQRQVQLKRASSSLTGGGQLGNHSLREALIEEDRPFGGAE